jgi:hypothetical protein
MNVVDSAYWGAALVEPEPSPVRLRLSWVLWAGEPLSAPLTLADVEELVSTWGANDDSE